MKGFKKDGKFRPTEGKRKSALKINDCVSKKIPKLRHEGKPQKQSIAIAESICRRKKESMDDPCECMMGGEHERMSSKQHPFETCTKCGDYIDNKDGKWERQSIDEHHKAVEKLHKQENARMIKSMRNKQSLDRIENPEASKELKQMFKEEIGESDIIIDHYSPEWKLTNIIGDNAEYYSFPNEESAIKFGKQSIRDTALDYIPDDPDSPEAKKMKRMSKDDLVDYIIGLQSDFGMRSELGAIAQSVASYDGQYSELSDGSIVFRIS